MGRWSFSREFTVDAVRLATAELVTDALTMALCAAVRANSCITPIAAANTRASNASG